MTIRLCDAELEAFKGLRTDAVALYVQLRRRMDYATGLIGARRGAAVSWEALREMVCLEPGPGVTRSGMPCRSRVRRMVQTLLRAGLLEQLNKPRETVVFRCLLAHVDASFSNKPGNKSTMFYQSESTACEGRGREPGKHPVSGLPNPSGEGLGPVARAGEGVAFGAVMRALAGAGLPPRLLMNAKSRAEMHRWVRERITADELVALAAEGRALLEAGRGTVGPLTLGDSFDVMRHPEQRPALRVVGGREAMDIDTLTAQARAILEGESR